MRSTVFYNVRPGPVCPKKYKQLMDASQKGDLERVTELLRENPDIDPARLFQEAPFCAFNAACLSGNVHLVQYFVSKWDIMRRVGQTPSIASYSLSVVSLLADLEDQCTSENRAEQEIETMKRRQDSYAQDVLRQWAAVSNLLPGQAP